MDLTQERNISISKELESSCSKKLKGDEVVIGRTGTVMGVKEASRREGKGKRGKKRFKNISSL